MRPSLLDVYDSRYRMYLSPLLQDWPGERRVCVVGIKVSSSHFTLFSETEESIAFLVCSLYVVSYSYLSDIGLVIPCS